MSIADLSGFHNALRIMRSIDMRELVAAGAIEPHDATEWSAFSKNPYDWLIRASDRRAEALWSIIEARQPRHTDSALAAITGAA